jgi:hypothetical protein
MKRSEALKLIANQLDFLNGRFHGLRVNFTEQELKSADVILTTLEQAGMQPPVRYVHFADGQKVPGSYEYGVADYTWEPEDGAQQDQRAFWDDDNRGSGAV